MNLAAVSECIAVIVGGFFLVFSFEKPSSRSLLAGEQSDALRILLRNDRKSRHRRIKKQRRYDGFPQEKKTSVSSSSIGLGK